MRSMASTEVSGDALLDAAEHGETVVVTRDGVPTGDFVPRPTPAAERTTAGERLAELERKYPPDPEFGDLLEKIHRELNESGGEVREWPRVDK